MITVVGETLVEHEDEQRAASALAGTPLLRDEAVFQRVARAFAGARAVEREACAKAAEAVQPITMGVGSLGGECRTWEQPNPVAQACAHAIRCRNKWVPTQAGGDPT